MQTKYNMLYNMKNKIDVSLGKQDHEDPYAARHYCVDIRDKDTDESQAEDEVL